MSNNYTITLSLGSGPKAEDLARRIKAWAAGRPVSEAIRNLILYELDHEFIGGPERINKDKA